MSYKASPSAGTVVAINLSGTFTNIPGVDGVQPFGSIKAMIDVTAIDDTAKKFVGDVPDPGELSFAVMLDVTEVTHLYLMAAANTTGQIDGFKVTPSNQSGTAKAFSFNAEVLQFQPSFAKGAAKKSDCKAKISGAVTLA